MNIKDAFIDRVICHHFSIDATKCVINNADMNLQNENQEILKEFFLKPFVNKKNEFAFSHHVDIRYNVAYQIILSMFQGAEFSQSSVSLFKHLQAISTSPTIKDGDVFIVKVEDILINNTYYEGIGIIKIETKKEFIETTIDPQGELHINIKKGFSANKIDKACLVIFTEHTPKVLIIDNSKDTKFWKNDFLGVIPCNNSYNNSHNIIEVFTDFVVNKLGKENQLPKSEQVHIINRCNEILLNAEEANVTEISKLVFQDKEYEKLFLEYKEEYEAKTGNSIADQFEIDKKAINIHKATRCIKLDDTAELHLYKTGSFIERGFDESKNMYYYKLFFSIEK